MYWGTRLACAEMIRTGTVRFWDMYWQPEAVARAVEEAGVRAVVGLPLVDGMDPKRAKEVQADGESALDLLAGFGPRVTPSLTPHGIYTVSEGTLEWAAGEATARDLPIHLHFLEIQDEVTGCQDRYGVSPAALLDRVGALGATTVLAHAVWTEEADLELIAERGATVVTNPVSNLKLAVGRIFPYAATRAHGIPVGLGTDGAASNNSLDLFADTKVLALLQKHAQDDPAALPADEAWSVATGALAPLLGGTPVAIGQPADFLLVRSDALALEPGNVVANLVYAASGAVVDATVVDGRVLMRDGTIEDEAEIVAHVRECARAPGRGRGRPLDGDDLERDRVLDALAGAHALRAAPQERVGVGGAVAQPFEVGAVLAQRGDAALEEAGHVDRVRGRGRCVERDEAHAVPGLEALLGELGEHPAVRGVARRVEEREADEAVVGVVHRSARSPVVAVVDRDDHVGPMAPDRGGEVASQRDPVLDDAVGVVEELDGVDAHLGRARDLFLGAPGTAHVGRQALDACFSAGDERVDDRATFAGPARDRTGRAVLEVVGVRRDRERARPVVGEGLEWRVVRARHIECGVAKTARTRSSKCSRGSVSYSGSKAIWSHSSANWAARSNHGSSRYCSRASGLPPKWW